MSPVEGVKPGIEARLDPFLVDQLRTGDINQILGTLPTGVTKEDVLDFLKGQWLKYKAHIQDEPFYAGYMTVEELSHDKTLPTNPDYALTDEDTAVLPHLCAKYSIAPKAAIAGAKAGADEKKPPTGEELRDKIEQDQTDFESTLDYLQWEATCNQLQKEWVQMEGEIKKLTSKIVEMVKSGAADAIDILLLMAKIGQMRGGLISSRLMMKVYKLNDEQQSVAQSLQNMTSFDPATFTQADVKLKNLGSDMSLTQMNLQKTVSNIEVFVGNITRQIEEIYKGRADIVRKLDTGR